tara:strand:- start:51 stop:479 length:429 start_codon:yes stop_codon:yes gene_type:complete
MMSQPSFANPVSAKVQDVYITVYEPIKTVSPYCEVVEVPIYETHTRRGDPVGSTLLGMILGGVSGKVITGQDNGAAAGAIVGGIIGADQGNRLKTERVIVGYRETKNCYNKVTYSDKPVKVYSYSTLGFTIQGKSYNIEFVK